MLVRNHASATDLLVPPYFLRYLAYNYLTRLSRLGNTARILLCDAVARLCEQPTYISGLRLGSRRRYYMRRRYYVRPPKFSGGTLWI